MSDFSDLLKNFEANKPPKDLRRSLHDKHHRRIKRLIEVLEEVEHSAKALVDSKEKIRNREKLSNLLNAISIFRRSLPNIKEKQLNCSSLDKFFGIE